MINENDAKTLNIVPDKEKQLHTYRVIYHLVNDKELEYTIDNVSLERKDVIHSICANESNGICNEDGAKVRGLHDDENICINMNLVTHIEVKEITND